MAGISNASSRAVRLLGAALITIAVIAPASAQAAPTWLAPQDLSDASQSAGQPQVALDAQGNAVAVWSRYNGAKYIVQAATRPAGGPWSVPQDLSATGQDAGDPQVALDAQGNAVAVWSGSNGSNDIVQTATRPAAGGAVRDGWSLAQALSDVGQSAYGAQVALDAQGNAVAVWSRSNGVNYIVQASTRPAGGPWSASQDLSAAAQNAGDPQVALDPQGNAVAVWTNLISRSINVIQAAFRPVKGSWGSAENVSSITGNADSPRVALDPQGDAVAVWRRGDGFNNTIEAATRRLGSWNQPQTISGPAAVAGTYRALSTSPGVALDGQGNAAAVWFRYSVKNEFLGRALGYGSTNSIVQAAGFDAAGPQLRDLSVPGSGSVGSSLSFSVSPVDVWSRVASTSWDFGDGTGAAGQSVSHSYSAPGSYAVRVSSTDGDGNASSATRTVVVSAADAGSPASTGGGGSAAAGGSSVGVEAVMAPGSGASQQTPVLALAPRGDVLIAGALASEAARAAGLHSCLAGAAARTKHQRGFVRHASPRRRAQITRRITHSQKSASQRCLARFGQTPGAISGLGARALSATQIQLHFKAPGNDANHPPAARSYLIKQSERPIRSARDYAHAQTLCAGACRFSLTRVGTQITLTITGLRPGHTYYYTIAARDNVSGRPGPRSHTINARTS